MIEGMKKTTMFSQPVKLTIDDTSVTSVYSSEGDYGESHYFFAKDNMTVCLSTENPDIEHQKRLVKTSIEEIRN